MSEKKMRVGFIGLGIMGRPMAEHILRAGHELTVFNRTAAKTKDLAASGAAVEDSPAGVAARSEVIITMVTDSPDVEQVIAGRGGGSGRDIGQDVGQDVGQDID